MLGKALEAGLEPVVCLNKIDRADARPAEVLDEIYGLFIDLGANEQQLDFPVIYTNARAGTATRDLAVPGNDLRPLFESIVRTLPGPAHEPDAPTQFQANNLGYDDYVGPPRDRPRRRRASLRARRAVRALPRRRHAGAVQADTRLRLARSEAHRARRAPSPATSSPWPASRTSRIGDTVADRERPRALPPIRVDEPTIAMLFGVNTSPWAGRSGSRVTSRQVRERLFQESLRQRQHPRRGDRRHRHVPRRWDAASCSSRS